jgi:hypothetical protein
MCNTYSVNKENIWISHTHVTIIGSVGEDVNKSFDNINSIQYLGLWNVYFPQWAHISVQKDRKISNLELRGQEPYDYAKIESVFPKEKVTRLGFNN